ncbi:hypothetical protein A3B57_01395 [Microgenomates group bacterium RIFCSPLOWO2_01_FULL_47_10]|nr:MAG: hypothetical protein A3B57_01395 [Microgenomates group bacterium RIFCSPLOWO2_01_FULL_47_10]
MTSLWIIYAVTIIYIVVLVLYFIRRSKNHEKELDKFLSSAKMQVEKHKILASAKANEKVIKAVEIIKKVQAAAEDFETKAQNEYDQIVQDAKDERREIIASAKGEIDKLFKNAETELETYRLERQKEIEKNLIKLVVAVAEKVVEMKLDPISHKQLIVNALKEIKSKRDKS